MVVIVGPEMQMERYGATAERELLLIDILLRKIDGWISEDRLRQVEFAIRLQEMCTARPDSPAPQKNEDIERNADEAATLLLAGPQVRRGGNRLATINLKDRTVDATISTESPVPMADFDRREMVPEILLAAGCILPDSGQVPLLDSHKRTNLNDQLGSVRGLRIEGTQVVGTLHVSSVHEDEWQKIVEGNSTDVSAGYQVIQKTYVSAGRTLSFFGRSISGPANVATKWKLREVSLVPIGADQLAKLRGLIEELTTRNGGAIPIDMEGAL